VSRKRIWSTFWALVYAAVPAGAYLQQPAACAATATVAVAANFASPLERLKPLFEAQSGYRLAIVQGSTGKLYAQIVHGAPFDAFLAADQRRPSLLAKSSFAEAASQFTYARGRLVLWANDPRLLDHGLDVLRTDGFRRLAIANPALAPYGAAAKEVLAALGVWETVEPKLVRGENIGQTFAIVATGNAELGLVAMSQAIGHPNQYLTVPEELYEPIRQDAILLTGGPSADAGRSFLRFLKGEEAARVIREFGYARQAE
jgi:molybdate transport system substrate-binding protein